MRNVVVAAVACLSLVGLSIAADVQASIKKDISIPAGGLGPALRTLSEERRIHVIFISEDVGTLRTKGASGSLTVDEALNQILNGTGLTYRYIDDETVSIVPVATTLKVTPITNASIGASNSSASAPGARASEKQANEGSKGVWKRRRLAQAETRSQSSRRALSENTAQDSTGPTGLEEIIVSARRRQESLQAVPIAITALSQQTLRENNVVTVTDLRNLVPSLSGTTGLSRDGFNVAIRGQTESNGRPGVIMYLNEVPVASVGDGAGLAGGPGLLFDLENVQVLKGPQGTLFGLNSVGGSVLLRTARPKNEFGGRIQLGTGNYSLREVDAAIDVPIVDGTLLTRVAFNGGKRDGFTWLQGDPKHPNGIDTDNRDYWSVRGSVSFRPSDWFENDTIATYQHYDSNGTPQFLVAVNPARPATLFFPTLPTYLPQQQALGIRTHIPLDTTLVSSGTLSAISNVTNIELADDLNWRTILGYDRAVTRRSFNTDATPLAIGAQPRLPRVAPLRQYTAETQLLGKSFGGRLDWIAGAFYLENPFEDYVLQTGLILGSPNDTKNKSSSTSRALFMQGTYDLSALLPGFKATGGLRYTWDSKTAYDIGKGFGTNCTSVPTVNCDESSARRSHTEFSALTWTMGLDYQVVPDTLLYLASRRGYRAGGINVNTAGDVLPEYGPEYVRDYEFGVKSDWHVVGRALRTNAAIYFQDYTDIQVTRAVFTNSTVLSFTDNASQARLWGGELEALLRLTDDLELGANASYLDIQYTEFAQGVSATTIADVKARERYSPSTQYGVNARYRLPVDRTVGDLSVQMNWSWQAAFRASLAASLGEIQIPAHGLLNLSVNWDRVGGSPVDASLFMSNAQDKDYVSGGNAVYNGSGYNTVTYGEPRMYGIRMRYRFGAE